MLLRGSSLYHFMGGTRSSRSTRLEAMKTGDFVEINPSDALKLGIGDGETARVCNTKANIPATLKFSESQPKGVLFCSYDNQSLSALFSMAADLSGASCCPVRIEKES